MSGLPLACNAKYHMSNIISFTTEFASNSNCKFHVSDFELSFSEAISNLREISQFENNTRTPKFSPQTTKSFSDLCVTKYFGV